MDNGLDTSPQVLNEALQRTRLRLHASVTPSALVVSPCVAGVVLVLGRPMTCSRGRPIKTHIAGFTSTVTPALSRRQ